MTLAPAALWLALVAAEGDSVRDLVLLSEDRPVFVRLRMTVGGRTLEDAWLAAIRALHGRLDRDGDGKVTAKEADKERVADLIQKMTGAAAAPTPVDLDTAPRDDLVSVEELADALHSAVAPFDVQISRIATGRTDALFDQLDRDKDEALTRNELAAISGSLRRLDLDDNEMISADELEPFNSAAAMAQAETASDRRARFSSLPPVVERVAGESSLRLARLLLKKYDAGKPGAPGRPDRRVSRSEMAIAAESFTRADRNGDDQLDTEELRRWLAEVAPDVVLKVEFAPKEGASSSVRANDGAPLPDDVAVRQLGDGDVEVAVGHSRLDVRLDGDDAAEEIERLVMRQFQAADANKNGYLEGKERDLQRFPLIALPTLFDDGDGKLYAKELKDFTAQRIGLARGRVALTVSDQGRAIFGVLDLDRDRRLSAREIMRTVERVTTWDADRDGRVNADEIPYHFLITIARGVVTDAPANAPRAVARPMASMKPTTRTAGPEWFRQMDRNRDGDVSRREFLGPRDQFNRIDRDKDGLIDAEEAGGA